MDRSDELRKFTKSLNKINVNTAILTCIYIIYASCTGLIFGYNTKAITGNIVILFIHIPKLVFYHFAYLLIGLPLIVPAIMYGRKQDLHTVIYIQSTKDIDPGMVLPLYLYVIQFKKIVKVGYEMRQYILATIAQQLSISSCESCMELYKEVNKCNDFSRGYSSHFKIFCCYTMENDEEIARKFVEGMMHYIKCNNLMHLEERVYKFQLLTHPKITSKSIICKIASEYLK